MERQPPGADCIRTMLGRPVAVAGASDSARPIMPLRARRCASDRAGRRAGLRRRADTGRRRASAVTLRRRDIALVADTTVVSARVASGATLASMLRAQDVAAPTSRTIVARGGVGVRSAEGARQRSRTASRRAPTAIDARLRVRNRRRSLAARRPRTGRRLVATVLPIPKTRRVEIVRGTIDRRAPVAGCGARRGGRDDRPDARARRDLRRRNRLHHRVAAGRSVRADGREAVSRRRARSPATVRSLAAEFINAGRRVRAVRFTPEGGRRATTTSAASRCGGSSSPRR